MREEFVRSARLLGQENIERLLNARVAVFGVGGVGGYVVEALVRSGIGQLDLIDSDRVVLSNINRQIIASHESLGEYKVDVAEKRCKEINPQVIINKYPIFYLPETADQFDFSKYDYVVDAIDTVSGKIQLVLAAKEAGVPIICSMGAGNKLDPTAFEVADLSKTSVCPLAKTMRYELKKRGIKNLKVVYSREEVRIPLEIHQEVEGQRPSPGSLAFVPAVAGLILAGEVVKDLCDPAYFAKTKNQSK